MGDAARICAQNFEAVLAMIVKLAGEAIFDLFLPGCIKLHFTKPLRWMILQISVGKTQMNDFTNQSKEEHNH